MLIKKYIRFFCMVAFSSRTRMWRKILDEDQFPPAFLLLFLLLLLLLLLLFLLLLSGDQLGHASSTL